MERFLMIKREPNWSQEIEEIVNIDNHLLMDATPSNVKFEYDNNNTISNSTPYSCSENYSAIKQELNSSYEEHPTHRVKNVDSVQKCFEIKRELDCSYEDHSINKVDDASSDFSLLKLRNAVVILQRLSTVQILEYLKKSETDSEYTYRLNLDAIKYVCKYSCSKCDRTVDTENIRHIISRPECGCIPNLAYQCMACNKQLASYLAIQKHVNQKGLCESRKRFLHLEGFNDDEWEKINCPKCNESLENIAQFIKHVNGCEEVPKFWCSLCDYGSTVNYRFRSHLKLHDSQSTKSKSSCSAEELTQNDECNRKKKKIISLKTMMIYCSKCDKTSISKGFRISSSNCNKCGTPYTYRCPECNKEYLTQSRTTSHMKRSCKTSKDYHCPVCKEKAFSTIFKLRIHMSHCGKTQNNVCCKFCPFKSKYKTSLYKHLKRYHENNRSFINQARDKGPLHHDLFCEQCSEAKENGEYRNGCYYCLKCKTKLLLQCRKCSLSYKTYRGISAHVASKCGLEKLQKCPKCDQEFQNLNMHINYCRDSTVYCEHCPYRNKRKNHLVNHLFHKHQNEF